MRQDLMRKQVHALESHIESQIPFRLLECDSIFPDDDSSVIAENIDPSKFSDYLPGRRLTRLATSDIALNCNGVSAVDA